MTGNKTGTKAKAAPKNGEKSRGRPFEPGNPGGPGRPTGSRNKATLALDAVADESAKAILEKLVESAKAGDMRAAELVLARVWPVRKGRPVALSIPPIATAGDVVTALGAVATAMAAGEITPEEAASVASVLEVKRRSIETADLAARIEAIEKGNRP
jgi:hypothetical protein